MERDGIDDVPSAETGNDGIESTIRQIEFDVVADSSADMESAIGIVRLEFSNDRGSD